MRWISDRPTRARISDSDFSKVPDFESFPDSVPAQRRDWLWNAALLSPFLMVILWELCTGSVYEVFWSQDEGLYHYPLAKQFARQWPHFDFVNVGSATTPFVHLAGAALIRFFGASLEGLRFMNMLFSAFGILCVARFLRNERGLSNLASTLGAAVLMLSFYFFGYSFRFVTDSIAFVFCLLALGSLYRFMAAPGNGLGQYWIGCMWVGLAIFSRQSCAFLCVPYGICLLQKDKISFKKRLASLAVLGAALVPTLVMFVLWKGLVSPPNRVRCTPGTVPVYLYAMATPLSVLGFYVVFFHAAAIRAWVETAASSRSWPRFRTILLAVVLAVACSVFLTGASSLYFGVLNAAARPLPHVFGFPVMTWLLLVIGLSALFLVLIQNQWLRSKDPGLTIAVLSFLAICAVSLSNSVAAQKYYDAQVLACLLLCLTPSQAENRFWKFAMSVLLCIFVVYQIARQTGTLFGYSGKTVAAISLSRELFLG